MATMTTTGYGDLHANSVLERFFSVFTMVAGKLMCVV